MPSDPPFIPLCIPDIAGNEWAYVKDCLDTGWVSSVGSYVDRFERELADYVGSPHAVAVVNGTAALHTALLVAGVQPDDEVLTSTLTFIAPANAIRYAGAWPVLVDANPRTWQMDVELVADFLQHQCARQDGHLINQQTGRRVSAIVPVHILGGAVDMGRLMALADEYGLPVIEDATEGLGGSWNGKPLGTIGDLGCYSFNGNKMMTTGGGGMLVTGKAEYSERARYLTTQAKDDAVEYVHGTVGFNYRLTNLQAAMGVAQVEQLDRFIESKRAIAKRYAAELSDVPGVIPMPENEVEEHAFWLYTIRVDADRFGCTSRELMASLHSKQVQARPLWQPLHHSPAQPEAQALGGEVADCLNREALSLPSSVSLTQDEQSRVIEAIRTCCQV